MPSYSINSSAVKNIKIMSNKKSSHLSVKKTKSGNTEENYSELLLEFLQPFKDKFPEDEYMDTIFDTSIAAWNLANMQSMMDQNDVDVNIADTIEETDYPELIKEMMEYKLKNFGTYQNFITEVEHDEEDEQGMAGLTLTMLTPEDYIASMEENNDEEEDLAPDFTEEDFEENYIDRFALILKPTEKFLDWTKSTPSDFELNEDDHEDDENELAAPNVYLIEESLLELNAWLETNFDCYFDMELENWTDEESTWPNKRTYKMFTEWFDIQFSKMVYDMEKKPVSKSWN